MIFGNLSGFCGKERQTLTTPRFDRESKAIEWVTPDSPKRDQEST